MDKRDRILAEAYKQLSSKGIGATKIEDIAAALQMSKKTIYLLFRSKEEIVLQTGLWKLQSIAKDAQSIVESDSNVIDKLIQYIECIYVNLTDVSMPMINNFITKRDKADEMINDYLHSAVLGRFNSLFEQVKLEGKLKDNSDPKSHSVMYWEMLSTFMLARPMRTIPKSLQIDQPINEMLCNQLVNLFRGLLNDVGIKEFDGRIKKHPILSSSFG
ncbi:MAG: TetR/AcrR family transcriptional regulator [Ekhidna sp.]